MFDRSSCLIIKLREVFKACIFQRTAAIWRSGSAGKRRDRTNAMRVEGAKCQSQRVISFSFLSFLDLAHNMKRRDARKCAGKAWKNKIATFSSLTHRQRWTQTDVSPDAPHPTSCSTSSLSSSPPSFHSAQQPVSSGTQLWLICLSRRRRETNTEPASPSPSPGSESQFRAGRLFIFLSFFFFFISTKPGNLCCLHPVLLRQLARSLDCG